MKNLSFIFFLIFLFVNCKRENCPFPGTKIEGIIIDDSTRLPIEGAKIYLQRKKCGYDPLVPGCDYIDVITTISDNEGKFKIKFCNSRKREYFLFVTKDGYYMNNGSIGNPQLAIEDFLNKGHIITMKRV